MTHHYFKCIMFSIGLAGMLLNMHGAAADTNAQDNPPSPTSTLMQQLEMHQQGWGQMGIDVAAHAAELETLPMRIADQEYAHGLGVHAPSESIFVLEGRFLRFEAELGVQWQDGGPGCVVFEVYVDEKQVFQSDLMTEHSPAVPVSISLKDADMLRLVVDDGGDSITNDVANWANARLVPDPDASERDAEAVNIAVFGRVNTSDPERKEGIRASRLEEVDGADLYLDRMLIPDSQGYYEAPVWEDTASIGIQWVERRRVRHLGLALAPGQAMPSADQVTLEFWEVPRRGPTPGGAPWQGQWRSLPGNLESDNQQLIFTPEWGDLPERRDGVYKYRWLIAEQDTPVQVAEVEAYTTNRWTENDFSIVLDTATITPPVSLELYNGFFGSEEDAQSAHTLETPESTVQIQHCKPGRWRMTDRTVLRFRSESDDLAFAIALDDVLREGQVYVPHAGALIKTTDSDAAIAALEAKIKADSTIRERVKTMPEQTFEQAIEHVHRADGDLGPTLLSLANDNFKFVLTREGQLSFEPDLEAANLYETGLNQAYPLTVQLLIEGTELTQDDIERQFLHQNGQWYPVADIHLPHEALEIVQRSYVAPLEMPGNAAPVWKSQHPLGVMELSLYNHSDTTATLPMRLQINHSNQPEALRMEEIDGHWLLYFAEQPVARLVVPWNAAEKFAFNATADNDLQVHAELEAGETLSLALLFPRWALDTEAMLALPTDRAYLEQCLAHWDAVMGGAMTASLPDKTLEDLMRASVIHCLLAARNEDYERIAPWIASIFYGPLESESNSIIRGLSYWGHDDFTQRALDYFIARYNDAGFLTTGYTTMGTGWHLWSVGEYIRLSQDQEWLRQNADEFVRVADWIMAQSEKTQVRDTAGNPVPEYGLVPPGPAADWDSFQYYFYINGYYYVGLKSIGEALASIDHPEAESMLAHAETHRQYILDAFHYGQERAPVVQLKDGSWVPFNPSHPYAWGLMEDLYPGQDVGRSWAYDVELGSHHLVPMGVMDPFAQETEWMLDHMEDVQFLKSGWRYYPQEENEADWFNLGGFAKVQPYYARNHDIYALRQDVKPFLRSYFNSIASLLNREDLSLWEHFFNGAYNKTHETGYLVYQSRIMLLMEAEDTLWIAPFIPQAWLLQDKPVVVENAPNSWGTLDYTIQPNPADGEIALTLDLSEMETLPENLCFRVRLPEDHSVRDITSENAINHAWDADTQVLRLPGATADVHKLMIHYDMP